MWIFIAFTMPLARIPIGAMPLYLIDIITIIGILYRKPVTKNNWHTTLVGSYLFFSFITMLFEAVYFDTFLSPTYMFLRYGLGIISFFIVQTYLTHYVLLKTILKTFILILLFNGLLSILYSLPVTGDFIENNIFGNGFLFPQRSGLVQDLASDRVEGFRAIGLVGGANINAFVLLLGLGVSFYLIQAKSTLSIKWHFINLIAIGFGLVGLIFTYSRQAYLGLVIMVFLMIYLKGKRRLKVVAAILTAVVVILMLKIDFSDPTFAEADRITESVEIIQGDREASRGETARILAYQLPFQLLFERPDFWFRGRGLANEKITAYDKISNKDYIYQFQGGESHSVIASAIFDRGGLAAFALIILITIIGWKSMKSGKKLQNLDFTILRRNIFISLVPAILFAHFFIDSRQGVYMLFITLGLLYQLNRYNLGNG
jgi:hypothetical protein